MRYERGSYVMVYTSPTSRLMEAFAECKKARSVETVLWEQSHFDVEAFRIELLKKGCTLADVDRDLLFVIQDIAKRTVVFQPQFAMNNEEMRVVITSVHPEKNNGNFGFFFKGLIVGRPTFGDLRFQDIEGYFSFNPSIQNGWVREITGAHPVPIAGARSS